MIDLLCKIVLRDVKDTKKLNLTKHSEQVIICKNNNKKKKTCN